MVKGNIFDKVNDITNSDNNSSKDNSQNIKKETEERKKQEAELHKQRVKNQKELNKLQKNQLKELIELEKKGFVYPLEALSAKWKNAHANAKDSANDTDKSLGQRTVAGLQDTMMNTVEGIGKAISKGFSELITGVDTYLTQYSEYMGKWNTRLQGTQKNYTSITKLIDSALGVNAYITQSKVFEKLNTYVQEGIAYNVEQRAFLGTVSDKIAATFEANNKTLLQIIRIQQADSTAARLGMESRLTTFLNSMYQDTTYLNGLSDSVSSAILGANSQLSRNGSLAFEYQVQKWLGSMSSVGVSENTIQSLAQGINALGTGDINSLSGNNALQNLLVMAANTAGLDYSSLLSGGMNENTTNKLMSGLVQYMQSIAGTSNQVVKSQYANIFGMTVSDLTSILNLSSQDLVSISNNMLDYSQAINETEQQLKNIGSRTSLSEKIQNVFNNVMSTVGEGIANNVASYTTYLLNSTIMKATGNGIEANIPLLGAVNLNKAIQGGIVGMSLLNKAGSIFQGLSNAGNLSLDPNLWNWNETTGRGNGLTPTFAESNVGKSVSKTTYIGNSEESAIYQSSITSANETAQQVTGAEEDDKMTAAIVNSIDPNVKIITDILVDWKNNGIDIKNYSFAGIPGLFN